MDGGLRGQPGDETAGRVHAAAAVDAYLHERHVGPPVEVERRAAPVALRMGRFLLHFQDEVVFIDRRHARLVKLLFRGLKVPHNAGRTFITGILNKPYQAEIQQVISCDHEQVVIKAQFVDSELDVAHGAEARLVRRRAVVEDGDALPGSRPFLEDMRELVVGNDDVAIDTAGGVDVVDEPVQDGLVPYLQEGFGEA